MIEDANEITRNPSLSEGMLRFELLLQRADGFVKSYSCHEAPSLMNRPSVGGQDPALMMPFLGNIGNILITIPTVGHNKFATDIGALTGWQMAIGIGTADELAADTALSSEITTYGGARASVTPTVLNNVVTWTHQWTFTTGASFAVIEAGVFKDTTTLMMRHKYSVAKSVVPTDKLTATLTDTL
jgi:hypothetical protein